MNNLNSKDIHEICDNVQKSVMDIVRQNLSQMKPQIMSEIKDELASELEKTYSARIHALESRIAKLEQQLSDKGMEQVQDSIKEEITTHKIDVSKIYNGFKYNGWIYYPNEEMGNFLYKVREDGSQNTPLTDYSIFSDFKINYGYLCFQDGNFRDRQIKLED